jgi:hypothetical protein
MKPFLSHRHYLLAALCLALAACGNTDMKESLGLTHRAPDEFRVYSRPPLSIPPDFNLQPPGTGGSQAAQNDASADAHQRILETTPAQGANNPFGQAASTPAPTKGSTNGFALTPQAPATPAAVAGVQTNDLPTSADSQFLSDAGVAQADQHIRATLAGENDANIRVKDDHYLINPTTTADPTVDAKKEAARIQQDKDKNQPITAGDTPVIVPKDKGLLGDIF